MKQKKAGVLIGIVLIAILIGTGFILTGCFLNEGDSDIYEHCGNAGRCYRGRDKPPDDLGGHCGTKECSVNQVTEDDYNYNKYCSCM